MTTDPYNAFLHLAPQPGTGGPVVGVKDVIDVAGMPTTAASRILHRVPDQDADCVARLRAAGATIAGKQNTHEFAFGALTNSPHFGPALNPWNTAHTCGGSSGGSGAAVAAGLVDVSLGTDTAGSVRIPAAFCGVTGARPSAGLVSNAGVFPTAPTLDTVGPLARSAEECRDILETLAGRSLDQPERDLRIGVVTSLFESRRPRRGRRVRGGDAGAARHARARRDPAARGDRDGHAADHAPRGDGHAPALAAHVGSPTTARTCGRACSRGSSCRRTRMPPACAGAPGCADEWERALGGYDVLVAPAMPIIAPRLDAIPPDYRLLVMPYNSPAALLGLPVVVAPCGFVDGLPVGACAHRPPRRGRRPAGACARVPGRDGLAPPEPD